MPTEAQELSIGILDGLHCEGCPRLRNVKSHSAYPPPIHESCPRDYVMQELGSSTTGDKLVESAKKHQLVFRRSENNDSSNLSCIILSCPNESRTFAGSLLIYTYAPQESVEKFIENLPGAMTQGKLEL